MVRARANPDLDFWVDGILQLLLGLFGIFINSIAIWILVSKKKMQLMFLHLLACFLIVDNAYLLMSMLTTLHYEFKLTTGSYGLTWIIANFTIPFKDIFYTAGVLLTLSLAYERYALITDTKGYRATMTIAPFRYKRLKRYLLCIALFSFLFNFATFFSYYPLKVENKNGTTLASSNASEVEKNNGTTFLPYNTSIVENNIGTTIAWKVQRSRLWKNKNYLLYDKGLKWQIFLSLSFIGLIFFTCKLIQYIRNTLQTKGPQEINGRRVTNTFVRNGDTNEPKSRITTRFRTEDKLSFALFGLIIVFFLCNSWFLFKKIMDSVKFYPWWRPNFEIVTRLMRTLNACVNVFVYCIADFSFRKYFSYYLRKILYLMTCTLISSLRPDDITEITPNGPGSISYREQSGSHRPTTLSRIPRMKNLMERTHSK